MMWKNYLKISVRSILKNKKISLINIIGLAAGLASSLIIFAYVNNELSYDKFHKNYESIYRINTNLKMGNNEINLAMSTPTLGKTMSEEYPEITTYTRIRKTNEFTLNIDEKSFDEKDLFYADSTFFDVFTYKVINGDPEEILNAPFSILLSEQKAKKYFGNDNPIGKKLIIDEHEYTVTGILEDIPLNTQMYCEFLISYNTLDAIDKLAGITPQGGFMKFQDDYVYLLVKPESDLQKLSEQMNILVDENVPEHFKPMYNVSLMPLKDIYFSKDVTGELEPIGNKKYIWIFLTISGILILIAAINFMNLSTSRYMHRVREVGMRKVFGAHRKHLIYQFMGESMTITLIALIIGIITAELLNPVLDNFIGKDLEISFFSNIEMFGFLVLITIFIGLISGSYPALFLSKFSPLDVFKLNSINGESGINIRRLLVIIQFTIASGLIIFTIFIFSQIHYARNADLGFNKENIALLSISNPQLLPRFETLQKELKSLPDITDVSLATSFPGSNELIMQNIPLAEGSDENVMVQRVEADHYYAQTMQVEIAEGRFFSEKHPSDQQDAIVINETAAKELNLENPIGSTIISGKESKRTVIGVIKDFHSHSFRNKIQPMIFIPKQEVNAESYAITRSMAIRMNKNKTNETLRLIENKWIEMYPESEFNYEFLDDAYRNQYASDIKMGKLYLYFSLLIILISCLGMYGLASFSTEKRMKEIGIRKILGGSVQNISVLLSKQFMVLVLISFIISTPIVYYLVEKWLRDFQYHIDINWLPFGIGLILMFTIALTSILIQILKATKTNPAEILRYE